MPTSYLPVNVGRYRRTLPADQQFGMVAIQFDNLQRILNEYKGGPHADAIVQEEMRAFGQDVLEPVFRLFAPYKEGGSEDSIYTWADRSDHIRDSLNTEWTTAGTGGMLILRARKQAAYTIRGNGSERIYPARGKNLRIELPGGQVIYRRWVGPNGANINKNWARDAWKYIELHNYINPYLERIGKRIVQYIMPSVHLPERPKFSGSPFMNNIMPVNADQARKILAGRTRPRARKASFSN